MPEENVWLDAYRADGTLHHSTRILGGAVDNPRNELIFLYIGKAVCSWARFERHLNEFLLMLNQKATTQSDEDNLFQEYHPTQFGSRVDMLERYFDRHPVLALFKERVAVIVDAARFLGELRNTVSHAVLTSVSEEEDRITFSSLRSYRPRRFETQDHNARFAGIRDLSDQINMLNRKLAEVSTEVLTPAIISQLQGVESPPWTAGLST